MKNRVDYRKMCIQGRTEKLGLYFCKEVGVGVEGEFSIKEDIQRMSIDPKHNKPSLGDGF